MTGKVESLRGIFAEIDKSDSNEVSFQDCFQMFGLSLRVLELTLGERL